MFIAIFNISINAIKFEDITVTFQPRYPRRPIIIITELVQPIKGIITHLIFLNIIHNVKIIKTKTPKPKCADANEFLILKNNNWYTVPNSFKKLVEKNIFDKKLLKKYKKSNKLNVKKKESLIKLVSYFNSI